MTNDRTRHIPAAEDFANKLHGKLTDAGSYSVLGPETRARWNRAHAAAAHAGHEQVWRALMRCVPRGACRGSPPWAACNSVALVKEKTVLLF